MLGLRSAMVAAITALSAPFPLVALTVPLKKIFLLRKQKILYDGVKEIILVAQDVTAWGEDIQEAHGLVTLLDGLLPISGLERLRLLSLSCWAYENLLRYMKEAGDPWYHTLIFQHSTPTRCIKSHGASFCS